MRAITSDVIDGVRGAAAGSGVSPERPAQPASKEFAMSDATALVESYLQIWNETDPSARRARTAARMAMKNDNSGRPLSSSVISK